MKERKSLKQLRFEANKTQLDLYLVSGVSSSRISLIENDRMVPTEEEKDKLAGALGVKVAEVAWPEIQRAS